MTAYDITDVIRGAALEAISELHVRNEFYQDHAGNTEEDVIREMFRELAMSAAIRVRASRNVGLDI